ncbi:MAG: hypothetical protein WC869_15835 [Phycisphaerae bacterium]|jgi:hypothetical protein
MLNTDLKVYKAKANGRMDGLAPVTSGVLQNVFPHVTSGQRAAGYFDYYKTFWKIADDADGTLLDPEIYTDAPTGSLTDYVLMFIMGQRDRVEDLVGYATGTDSQRKYGSAYLKADVAAIGAATCVVTVKNAAMATGADSIIAVGDIMKITSKATADALVGNEETFEVASFVVAGLDITITRVGTFQYAYAADLVPTPVSPRVSSLIKPGDLAASVTVPVKTSAAGTIDFTTSPLVLDNIGTVDEDWTLTFTDATHFTLSGDSLGVLGTGLVSADYLPNNTDFTKPYFTLALGVWGGVWAAGDTVTFTTHPAASGIGQKRVVPALSASLANNKTTQVLGGEAV